MKSLPLEPEAASVRSSSSTGQRRRTFPTTFWAIRGPGRLGTARRDLGGGAAAPRTKLFEGLVQQRRRFLLCATFFHVGKVCLVGFEFRH